MIRPYQFKDKEQLLNLIRLNIPEYFAESEIADFSAYLDQSLELYYVVEMKGEIVGCGGINFSKERPEAIISWDIIHPGHQGRGIGKALTQFRINVVKKRPEIRQIVVRTAQNTYLPLNQ